MTVKVSAKLTREEQDRNGLDRLRAELVDQPHGRRYAVIAFEVLRVTKEVADGEEIPTVRLVHIEPLADSQADAAKVLLEEAYAERTGKNPQQEFDFGVPGPDGERVVPPASGEEILAEREERLNAEAARVADEAEAARGGEPA